MRRFEQSGPTKRARELKSVLAASPEGKTATIRPRVLVLCAGGIETARLLLYSNEMSSAGLG